MDPAVTLGMLGVLIAGLAACLYGEARGNRPAQWIGKPAASAAFVALALHAGALGSAWGLSILVALVLSLAGDMLLIPDSPRVFRLGILAFIAAHAAFIAAFAMRQPALAWTGGSLVLLVPSALIASRWILPRVAAHTQRAVVAYMVIITAMVALAVGASEGGGPRWLAACALAFYANDLLVAKHRFVGKEVWHRLVGLPLYYAAQAGFALSVA